MAHSERRTHIGKIVRIRETNELAVVVSDNLYLEPDNLKWTAVIRTFSGRQLIYPLQDLQIELPDSQTFIFREAVRKKFPELHIN